MPTDRIKLIYVASIGRSGTTLFESMLGAHPHLATCGEVHLWPHEITMGGVRPCGSGQYVQTCPFWQEMEARVDPLNQPEPRIHHFREHHDGGRTLRWNRWADFSPDPLSSDVQAQVDQYAANNEALFRHFRALVTERTGTEPEWIVDASKDPYRLLWLLRSDRFTIKVVHMVKHPCGFAYSVTKPWVQSPRWHSAVPRLYYTARQSTAWVIQNHLFGQIARHHLDPSNYMLMQYETLASAPHDTFESACNMIGVPYVPEAVTDFREGSQFTIAGNPMRYEQRGIELDERWKYDLPPFSRSIARTITTVNRRSFGYV
ncbi:MAG: sulfotransferase [Longimonas sp.]|uniref:sulfotransferase n=1 Tax=Longimonas sp. TaxID=2039626 RepID=UPI0033453EBF